MEDSINKSSIQLMSLNMMMEMDRICKKNDLK
ncbi:hypothetical protein SDC9_132844 [bioreactor metagenome]|uniref:Uncharacterized protein n=2 Tax=root TaxID=1 RepID=A0A645DA20_9ZZZZ